MGRLDDVKPMSSREKSIPSKEHTNKLVEEEPASVYNVKWRTALAVFALSLSNVCAAIANTVC
jgi:hypothetical protein